MSSEFPTASAADENTCEEKTVLLCGRCSSGAECDHLTRFRCNYYMLNCYLIVIKCNTIVCSLLLTGPARHYNVTLKSHK